MTETVHARIQAAQSSRFLNQAGRLLPVNSGFTSFTNIILCVPYSCPHGSLSKLTGKERLSQERPRCKQKDGNLAARDMVWRLESN